MESLIKNNQGGLQKINHANFLCRCHDLLFKVQLANHLVLLFHF